MRQARTSSDPTGVGRGEGGIYLPREDTFLLLPFARVPISARVLEIGTGSGRIALDAARGGASVVATDLNRTALRAVRHRALGERLDLSVVRTDLAGGLGRFDVVLMNPPYLPTGPDEHDPDPEVDRALDGGPDGARVLERFVAQLPDHLAARGTGYVVVSSVQDPAALRRIAEAWHRRGGLRTVVASRPLEGERLEVWKLTLPGEPSTSQGYR